MQSSAADRAANARHDIDPVVGIRQLDVHMQAAQHVALADHLQVVMTAS